MIGTIAGLFVGIASCALVMVAYGVFLKYHPGFAEQQLRDHGFTIRKRK